MPPGDAETWLPVAALIGLRCSGKTSVGRELARQLGAPFVDLDEALVADARAQGRGESVAGALLAAAGEPAFRELEARTLFGALASRSACVLATGGGVVELEANRRVLAERAHCIWLRAPLAVLAQRLRRDALPRPALGGGDAADELAEQERRRDPHYAALAALELDTSSADPAGCVRRLRERLIFDPAHGFRVVGP